MMMMMIFIHRPNVMYVNLLANILLLPQTPGQVTAMASIHDNNGKSSSHPLSLILEGGRRSTKRSFASTSPTPSITSNGSSHHHHTTPRGNLKGGAAVLPTPRAILGPQQGDGGRVGAGGANISSTKAEDEAFIRRIRVHQDLQTVYTRVFTESGFDAKKVRDDLMMPDDC